MPNLGKVSEGKVFEDRIILKWGKHWFLIKITQDPSDKWKNGLSASPYRFSRSRDHNLGHCNEFGLPYMDVTVFMCSNVRVEINTMGR